MATLADNRAATLPINIVDPGYTDLSVTVLAYDRSIQAREFSGNLASRKPVDQKAFAAIRTALLEIVKELETAR